MSRTKKKLTIHVGEMTPTEAQQLLEINSSMFGRLIHNGRLPARMLDQRGAGFRRWIVKRADVLKLKTEGVRTYNKPRSTLYRILWETLLWPHPGELHPGLS